MDDGGARDLDPGELPVLFVCGLHRSGTTALARVLGSAPGVHALRRTGVPADEGQHLQPVVPPASVYGGPGRFALDPRSALTETSELATPETARAVLDAWAPYWRLPADRRLSWGGRPGTAVLVEKSPPNLVRTRFLQRLFPRARFVVVRRHPAVVAVSTRTLCQDPGLDLAGLLRHWVVAHERYAADAPHLGVVHELRYEDLVARPAATLRRLAAVLGIDGRFDHALLRTGRSEPHLDVWRAEAQAIPEPQRRAVEAAVVRYGYALAEPYVVPVPD